MFLFHNNIWDKKEIEKDKSTHNKDEIILNFAKFWLTNACLF